MTYPFDNYDHTHISEREVAKRWPDGQWDPAGWEDCLWASAVEVARYGGMQIPATLAEAEAIRDAAGVTPAGPGSNHDGLERGMRAKYGKTFRKMVGEPALLALKAGQAAVISGSLGGFVLGHPLRRWDTNFVGGHAVAVFRVDDTDRFWWCDPLGPSTYTGQWVTDSQVIAFMWGGSVFSTIDFNEFAPKSAEEDVLKYTITADAGGQVKVLTGNLWKVSDGTLLKVASGYLRVVYATVKLDQPLLPTGSGDMQTGYLTSYNSGVPYFILGKDAEKVVAPTEATFTKAQLDAQLKTLKDQIAAYEVTLTAINVRAAADAATHTELVALLKAAAERLTII